MDINEAREGINRQKIGKEANLSSKEIQALAIKLEGVGAQCSLIDSKVTEVDKDLQQLDAKVDKISDTINGNGGPGLKTQVALNKEELKGIAQETRIQKSVRYTFYVGFLLMVLKDAWEVGKAAF